jgi:putative ABC transport system permease protein
MLKNYLIVALRNFRRNKIFSLINVLGLSIGISASLVIFLIVQYDYSFDRFEKEGDRIFRIVSDYSFQGSPGHTRGVQAPLANAIKKELSGIDLTVSFRYFNVRKLAIQAPVRAKPAVFKSQKNIVFAGADYFQLLSYTWLAGSPQSALSEPGRVVLSESRAKLYFPSMPYGTVIGRSIVYDDTIRAQVSGIVQDFDGQGNTDFSFKEFISLATILDNTGLRKKAFWDDWGSTTSDQQLYLLLSKKTTPASVEARLKTIFEKYRGEDARKNHYTWVYLLQPLSDIHFNSQYGSFTGGIASRPTLYGLMFVAAFILLLGSINFINLMTAQASQRAREIGIRKAVGGSRRQLVFQFLNETFLITLVATGLSIILVPLLLSAFTDFIPEGLHFSLVHPSVAAFLVTLVLIVSLLAGFYPALVLSSWNPLHALKTQTFSLAGATGRRSWIRQGLTISQFIIAQFFVMGTLLVSKQIRFMTDKDLGFSKEGILSINIPPSDTSVSHRQYLLNELKKIPGISLASLANDVPSSWGWWTSMLEYKEGNKDLQNDVELKSGDANYLKLFHIPLVVGRDLLPSDTVKEILINETYLQALGFRHPEDAIGKTIHWNDKLVPIVGIIRDFHAHPLYYKIAPMAFFHSAKDCSDLIISLQTQSPSLAGAGSTAGPGTAIQRNDWKGTISKMEQIFKKTYPEEEFNYAFFDESIASSYSREQNISHLLEWATGLTIFISCLGLLGLVMHTIHHRTREIGVRKVLGASIAQIVTLLSKDYVKLVGIAFIIASPLTWWAIYEWLDNFALRTSMSWWVFILGGLGMIAIALGTLSVQTIRAAMANPVNSLRTE